MIDIKNEKEVINKEVELIQHELSNNSKYAHSDQYKLNEKLNSLEKRGWDLYHSEGMGGAGTLIKLFIQLKMMDLWNHYLNFKKKNQRII